MNAELETMIVFSILPRLWTPGESLDGVGVCLVAVSFNPPPAVMPGESAFRSSRLLRLRRFQSAPGCDAGGINEDRGPGRAAKLFQSAPGCDAGGIVAPAIRIESDPEVQSAP